ncbi:glycosyltransferase family 2 protein [Leptospira idonii]|uniref:Glycosyltransferase n=1 Tax=Leptospira idonii TaxID=1193500 RepID=A0A4R9LZF0_9LEPT|nr:glycosyltransferase family 2 protein [Leptospira idonii]TGN18299.1 glycosyltransferase [Leptospira idonii]
MVKKKSIDIVIPCMNEEDNVWRIYERIHNVCPPVYDLRLIFVDDGSKDATLKKIRELQQKYPKEVFYISFSRNYGHQKALKAGLDHSTGDAVISIDADMQQPPELIPEMIRKWEEGFDIVYTRRIDNESVSFFKKITAKVFYHSLNYLSGVNIDSGAADFRLLDRKVVDVVASLKEEFLFIRGMISYIGFNQFPIDYTPAKREHGQTKYTFKKMFQFALEGITSFSTKPLHLATILGFSLFAFSIAYSLYAVYVYFFTDIAISGWTSLLVSVLLLGGVQLMMLGILGEYIGKMFIEVKSRPMYIIQEKKIK